MRICISTNREALTEVGNIPGNIKVLNILGVMIILDEDENLKKNSLADEKGNSKP